MWVEVCEFLGKKVPAEVERDSCFGFVPCCGYGCFVEPNRLLSYDVCNRIRRIKEYSGKSHFFVEVQLILEWTMMRGVSGKSGEYGIGESVFDAWEVQCKQCFN